MSVDTQTLKDRTIQAHAKYLHIEESMGNHHPFTLCAKEKMFRTAAELAECSGKAATAKELKASAEKTHWDFLAALKDWDQTA